MIQHIYVVDNSGVPMFVRCVGHDACPLGQFDSVAASGLLTALNNFANELGGGGLQEVHMQRAKFLLKTDKEFFVVFQMESGDKTGKYQKSITNLSSFVQSVYSEFAPFSKEERLKLIPRIESILDESGVLTEKGLLQKIKSFASKLFKKG